MKNSKIVNWATFLLAFSLGFDRPENVYFFYLSFAVFSAISIHFNLKHFTFPKTPFIIKGYIAFSIFAGLSFYWAIDKNLAMDMFLRLVAISYLMYIVFVTNEKYDISTSFIKGLITLIVFNFILFISPLKYLLLSGNSNRFSGTFLNANDLSLAVIFTIFFYSKLFKKEIFHKINYYILFIIISLFLIFSTGSRKGLIFGLLLILFSFFTSVSKLKQIQVFFLFLFIFPIMLLSFSGISSFFLEQQSIQRLFSFLEFLEIGSGDNSTKWRFIFIEEGINIFNENSIKGIGIDNFQTFFGPGLYAHNNYVEILADLGIAGFILLYSIYVRFLIFLKRNKSNLIDYFFFSIILIMEYFMVSYYSRLFWLSFVIFYFLIRNNNKNLTYDYSIVKI